MSADLEMRRPAPHSARAAIIDAGLSADLSSAEAIRQLAAERDRLMVRLGDASPRMPGGSAWERDALAAAIFDMTQGVVGEASPVNEPVELAEAVRDRVIALYEQVTEIYGDTEGMGGAYGDALDVIGAALTDLATAYKALGAADCEDGMDEAVERALSWRCRYRVDAAQIKAAGVTKENAWRWAQAHAPQLARNIEAGRWACWGVSDINAAATSVGRPALDVIAEMAAMEVGK